MVFGRDLSLSTALDFSLSDHDLNNTTMTFLHPFEVLSCSSFASTGTIAAHQRTLHMRRRWGEKEEEEEGRRRRRKEKANNDNNIIIISKCIIIVYKSNILYIYIGGSKLVSNNM